MFLNLKSYITLHNGATLFQEILLKTGVSKKIYLSSSWYDAYTYFELLECFIESKNRSKKDIVIEITQHMLEKDLNGVYRIFLKVASPRFVLPKVPKLMGTYSNCTFGREISNEKGLFVMSYKTPSIFFENSIYQFEGGIKGILNACKSPMKSCLCVHQESQITNGEPYTNGIFEITY